MMVFILGHVVPVVLALLMGQWIGWTMHRDRHYSQWRPLSRRAHRSRL